jgi:hypothetical protein
MLILAKNESCPLGSSASLIQISSPGQLKILAIDRR